ncbi:hypothetical protein CVV43_04500 [Candidatus Saccharibacteria bacterium HGW-Saccharibacteria-1]|nr:MAG: hypothetical protein CVV43_04500 [Candidatus Saccharibacteria bacterium HGW-Saccharibacteria-1]
MNLSFMASASEAIQVVRDYVGPTLQILIGLAGLASVFFITYGGFVYITSRGQPDKLANAKHIIKNALIGLVIVIGAATLTSILTGAIQPSASPAGANLPKLEAIEPQSSGNGLVDVMISAITGLLNNIIQAIATPFLISLDFFTKSTPLMTQNPSVFNMWLVMVGIADVLFVLVIALIGFKVMSMNTLGLDEIDLKHLLPRVALIFLLLNISIFMIDGIIAISNVLIDAVNKLGGDSSVWSTLILVFKEQTGQSVAALLIMLVFLIFSIILLVFYITRLVTLFIGAVLSPLVILLWLIPGFRDFSETAIKTYLTTIFTLFIHVVILLLASSLFTGMAKASGSDVPNVLIAMVTGLATIITLLKTQGFMMQLSYVNTGARSVRQLGSQFVNGVSYLGGKGRAATSAVSSKVGSGVTNARNRISSSKGGAVSSGGSSYNKPPTIVQYKSKSETGKTTRAPVNNKPLVTVRKVPANKTSTAKSIKEKK